MKGKLSAYLIEETRTWFHANGRDTAVIGISGGKDSGVVAAICKEALGADSVFGVLMPDGVQPDLQDALQVVEELGIPYTILNIGDPVSALYHAVSQRSPIGAAAPALTPEAKINVPPRIRMTCLYAVAQSMGGHAVVVGTGNAAECYVGYTTKWGDSASDFNPIRNLWVHQVLQVGDELGYFPNIIHKRPADGLSGKTDEERLGFSYEDVYRCFKQEPLDPLLQARIEQKHTASTHKRQPIPAIELP